MKKLISLILTISLLLFTIGCETEEVNPSVQDESHTETTQPPELSVNTEPPVVYQAPLIAITAPVIRQDTTEDGKVIFTHACQELSLTAEDPQVLSAIEIDYLNRIDFDNSSAPKVLAQAREAYDGQSDWSAYSFSVLYDPMRLDQSVLSLYGTQIVSNGSPRPTAVNISLTYDLLTGHALALRDILVPEYSADALIELIIHSLEEPAGSGILYSDYAYVISEMFSTNTPVETWFLSSEGLCFYFAPYEIAPYSEGTIVAEIPYAHLPGLLKDEYFPSEEVDMTGNILLKRFQDADLSGFSAFVELILDEGGTEFLIHTDGAVKNLRIETGTWLTDGSFNPEATVFAAATLCSSDGLMLQATESTLQKLRLVYETGDTTVSVNISTIMP